MKFFANGQKMSLAIRERITKTVPWKHLGLVAAAIVSFSWLGPFGTAVALSPTERVFYWGTAIATNWAIAVFVIRFLRTSANTPSLPKLVIGAFACAVPGTSIIWGLEYQFNPPPPTGASTLAYIYCCVVSVHLMLSYLGIRFTESFDTPTVNSSPVETAQFMVPANFCSRLSPHLGTDLLHLKMQDHYVEAHTSHGHELVLMRFRDALREVDRLDGLQVHRSHWVARVAVVDIVRRDRRIFLKLSNDTEVPVSRSYVKGLREAGWL